VEAKADPHVRGFDSIYSRCDDGWHNSVQAVSERLELWGDNPEEAYRIASESWERRHQNTSQDR